jgi:ribonuclease P protein component
MRFTFKKEERLYGHAALDTLYNNGKHISSHSIKIIYLEVPETNYPCRVIFSVPKRSFKRAVDRNLIKRRMREVYRNHKHILYNDLNEKQKSIHIYMIYLPKEIIPFDELKDAIPKALKIVVSKLN